MKLNILDVIRSATVAASVMTISGCSILSPVAITPPTQYALTDVPAASPVKRHSSRIILVMTPDAAPYYKTTQMAYELKTHQVSFFTLNAWAEPPAQMLQPLLVKTLQNTNRYRAIVSPPVAGNYDYMLTTQILKLRVNYDTHPSVFAVTLRVQIFNANSNKAIATKDISVSEPICGGPFYNRVLAANRAVSKALAQVSRFCLNVIR